MEKIRQGKRGGNKEKKEREVWMKGITSMKYVRFQSRCKLVV